MKRILLASACFLALSGLTAFAADAPPAKTEPTKPTCGKTAEECQPKVDELTRQVATLNAAYQGASQQRDIAQKAKADVELNAYILQITAPAAKQ